jgi:hypothetical protein
MDRGCPVVSATDPHGRNLGFLDRSSYFSIQVAPQLSSRGSVDPVPDPLFLRKSGSAGNRNRDLWISGQELWPLNHRGGRKYYIRTEKGYDHLVGLWKEEMREIIFHLLSRLLSLKALVCAWNCRLIDLLSRFSSYDSPFHRFIKSWICPNQTLSNKVHINADQSEEIMALLMARSWHVLDDY